MGSKVTRFLLKFGRFSGYRIFVLDLLLGCSTAVSSRRTCKEVPKKRLAADFKLMNKAENRLGKVMKMRSFLETAFRKLPGQPRGRRIPLGVCFKVPKVFGQFKEDFEGSERRIKG